MTTHYLIRHTPPLIEEGLCYGQTDLFLKDGYEQYFKDIKKKLPKVSKVYSSPLQRCLLLANYLSENVIIDDRLKEINFGDWELLPWVKIPKYWYQDYENVRPPNGENLIDLKIRVEDFFQKTLLNSKESVLVVSHHGPLRMILSPDDIFKIKIDYGEIKVLDI